MPLLILKSRILDYSIEYKRGLGLKERDNLSDNRAVIYRELQRLNESIKNKRNYKFKNRKNE